MGISSEEGKVNSYRDFTQNVLPRIARYVHLLDSVEALENIVQLDKKDANSSCHCLQARLQHYSNDGCDGTCLLWLFWLSGDNSSLETIGNPVKIT